MNKKQNIWRPGQPCPVCKKKGKTKIFRTYQDFRRHWADKHQSKSAQVRRKKRYEHFKMKKLREAKAVEINGKVYTETEDFGTYENKRGDRYIKCPHPDCMTFFPLRINGQSIDSDQEITAHIKGYHRYGLKPYRPRKQHREPHYDAKEYGGMLENYPRNMADFMHVLHKVWRREKRDKARKEREEKGIQKHYYKDPIKYVFHQAKAEYVRKHHGRLTKNELYEALHEFEIYLYNEMKWNQLKKWYEHEEVLVESSRKEKDGSNKKTATRVVKTIAGERGHYIHKIRCPECFNTLTYDAKEKRFVCIHHDNEISYKVLQANPSIRIEYDDLTGKPYFPKSAYYKGEINFSEPLDQSMDGVDVRANYRAKYNRKAPVEQPKEPNVQQIMKWRKQWVCSGKEKNKNGTKGGDR